MKKIPRPTGGGRPTHHFQSATVTQSRQPVLSPHVSSSLIQMLRQLCRLSRPWQCSKW